MRTVALRFTDKIAPEEGTIKAHKAIIEANGFVWYGKLGLPLSQKAISYIKENDNPIILLIHSGKTARYWAYVSDVIRSCPEINGIPPYYRDMRDKFNTWFKVTRFEEAPSDIMAKCRVISSGATLGVASKHSMSPYFIIECKRES